MDLVVRSADELLAAVPHVLGFHPEESIVLVPLGPGLPITRVDVPTTTQDRHEVWEALRGPFSRHTGDDAAVGIVCITQDRGSAELVSQHLSRQLETVGVTTHLRLWADGERWCEFNSGATGLQSQEAADRLAAKTVLAGAAQPVPTRTALADSLVGDREPIGRTLGQARAASAARPAGADRVWALARLRQFQSDGNRLSDTEGARFLVALETISTRDALWEDMSTQNSTSHIALWTDLTRRAPEEVRAEPASMLGFASWLHGDGARAWCALDQIPADQPYAMAAIVASALQSGLHPNEWEHYQAQIREVAREIDESFVPKAPAAHGQRDVPLSQPATDRPAPGR